jgi:hypothetical protein
MAAFTEAMLLTFVTRFWWPDYSAYCVMVGYMPPKARATSAPNVPE